MEYALGKSDEGAERGSLYAHLKTAKDECPKKINDHTTLKSITMRGVTRLRYLYRVSESGRPDVNMNNQFAITRQIIERTKSSPLTASIVNMDMGVDHFFEDGDGKCMLWIQLTKKDYEGVELVDITTPESEEKTEPVTIKAFLPEQFGGATRDADNPAGVRTNPFAQ